MIFYLHCIQNLSTLLPPHPTDFCSPRVLSGCISRSLMLDCSGQPVAVPRSVVMCVVGDHKKQWSVPCHAVHDAHNT